MTRLHHVRNLILKAESEAVIAQDLGSVPRMRDRGKKHGLWACFYAGRVDVALRKLEKEMT